MTDSLTPEQAAREATLAHALDELDAHGPHTAAEDRARQLAAQTPEEDPTC